MPSARQDSDGSKLERGARARGWAGGGCAPSRPAQSPSRPLSVANSVASYENEGVSGPRGRGGGQGAGPGRAGLTPCSPPEPACEDDDDDEEEDYHNEGYL